MPQDKPETAPPKAPAKPLLVAAIVATAFFMETLDSTAIATALPKMAETFGRNPVELSIGITIYMLTIGICIPASGWIADRFGTCRVFCGAIAIFTLGSAACGFTDDLWGFVAARIVQGIGGAMMSPVGRLAVLRTTEKKDLVRVLNYVIFPGLMGLMVGPPVGGFITTYLSWRWIFYVNLPIGLLGILLARRFVPNLFGSEKRPFDAIGFFLNGGGLGGVIYGMDLIAGARSNWPTGGVLVAVGAMLLALGVRHALTAKRPILDLKAMRVRSFAVTNTGGALFIVGSTAPALLLPLLFQVGLGMSAFASGLLVLSHSAGDISAKGVTTATIRLLGFRTVLLLMPPIYAVLLGCCAFFTTATPVPVIVAILFAFGAIRSFKLSALSSMQFADIPRGDMTAASTLSSVTQQITRAAGIAAGAVILNITAALRGAAEGPPSLTEFQVAFAIAAIASGLSVFWYRTLDPAIGSEVSGHKRNAA